MYKHVRLFTYIVGVGIVESIHHSWVLLPSNK